MLKFMSLLSFLSLLSIAPAIAENMSLYDTDISVDVTAENASVAREKAMSEANRQAVTTVAGRLTTPGGLNVLNNLNNNQILNFIKEVTIDSEKVSDVRYIAQLKITINGDILKTYLQEKNAPIAMVEESKIIIIPIFREFSTDTPLLWESQNLWRQAWEANPQFSGPIKISSLSTDNNNKITAAQALQMNGIILDQIATDTQTRNIYIADAVYDGIDGLDITLYAYNDGSQEGVKVPGARGNQLFSDAVQNIKDRLTAKFQQQSRTVSQTQNEITVLYAFNNLRNWVEIQNLLKNTAGVNAISVDALGTGKVQFKLLFTGSEQHLLYSLRDKNLNLKPYGTFYNLERY